MEWLNEKVIGGGSSPRGDAAAAAPEDEGGFQVSLGAHTSQPI